MSGGRAGIAATLAAFALALGFALVLHGAVPFVALPTLGQAVWTTGFSQSFLNDSPFAIYATNFGAPQPAAIAFGLAGAWPAALLMAAGLHPADAYSAMVALWLGLALFAAYLLARMSGAARPLAVLGALLWLTMPIIWVHAEYSMLSLGIALLPFYFLSALGLLLPEYRVCASGALRAALHLAACVIAAFMDGYSFVMFALGGGLLGAWLFARSPERRRPIVMYALPVHLAGVALAAALYLLYFGGFRLDQMPMGNFRAWGLDLAFLAVPTRGIHWLPDALGLSAARSEARYFGDWSVWSSTFALPALVAALWAWWKTRRAAVLATGLLIALLLGFYLALGPSLKVDAVKTVEGGPGQLMSAADAVAPTGSAWLYATVPGLREMRATYRWLALAVFCAWLLLVVLLAARKRSDAILAAAAAGALALINLPDLPRKWSSAVQNREMFLRIDSELLGRMRQDLQPRERVAFLPFGNDFLVNYLAARLDVVSYNIGGDRNLEQARRHWPEPMRLFRRSEIDKYFPGQAVRLLARREADSIVLPYVDLLQAAHRWPVPAGLREAQRPVRAAMAASGFVTVREREHYAVVRLNAESARAARAGTLESAVMRWFCVPPGCLRQRGFEPGTRFDVGQLENGRLVSDGRRGFLYLGPYEPLIGGRYRVVIRGTGVTAGEGWVDVVSRKGTVDHGRFPLLAGPPGEAVLAQGVATLAYAARDLEIRVFVTEGDAVRLEGFEVAPLR